jgi:uncharacterized protein (DUF488 family)
MMMEKGGKFMKIYTIGHSNHSKEYFLDMLRDADINYVADIRAFPGSRKHPQYKSENMKEWLQEARIEYDHFPLLGGRRRQSSSVGVELNEGWKNPSFHNYADFTLTKDFIEGLKKLKTQAKKMNVAYMCSERHPARCHRLLVSNWLQANNWEVLHIIDDSKKTTKLVKHELGKWGAMPIIEEDGTVVYPSLYE